MRAVEDGGCAAPDELAGLDVMGRLDVIVVDINKKGHFEVVSGSDARVKGGQKQSRSIVICRERRSD